MFFKRGAADGLKTALAEVCDAAEQLARDGTGCIVLSDKTEHMEEDRVPIPMLLAVGAVHHRLVKAGLRSDTSIVAEVAQCVSTHHVALLVGYGAFFQVLVRNIMTSTPSFAHTVPVLCRNCDRDHPAMHLHSVNGWCCN